MTTRTAPWRVPVAKSGGTKWFSKVWTYLLIPLSLLCGFLFAVAIGVKAWLSATTLGIALLLSVLRVMGAISAGGHEREHETAAAAMWSGEEYGVGLDAAGGIGLLMLFMVGAVVMLPVAIYFDVHGNAWTPFAVCVLCALALASRIRRFPAKLLQVTRQGIWDAQFGWVTWPQVEEVSVLDVHEGENSSTWLQVRLVSADVPAATARFAMRGDAISRRLTDRVLQYRLSGLALLPEHALAAARGWLDVSRTGQGPVATGDAAKVAASASAAAVARAWMRRATIGIAIAYALFPLAFVADLVLKGPR